MPEDAANELSPSGTVPVLVPTKLMTELMTVVRRLKAFEGIPILPGTFVKPKI